MDLQDFLAKFADLFNEKDAGGIKYDTKFKELEEWSSLIALSVIAMIEDEYSIAIKGNDIRNSDTVENLFNAVKGYK